MNRDRRPRKGNGQPSVGPTRKLFRSLQSSFRRRKDLIPLYLTEDERAGLRAASRFNAELMDFVRDFVRPGVTTNELDRQVHQYTLDHGHTPATLGYKGSGGAQPYPKSICTSINEVVCHGIPGNVELKPGDIVNVDLTSIVNGWYGDQSETFLIGEVSATARKLVQVTFDCLYLGIDAIQPGGLVSDIGQAIERYAERQGFSVVREYQGHGLGREFHQEPGIPHYAAQRPPCDDRIEPGTCFTIEPMINEGRYQTFVDSSDGWTVRTVDLKLSAQFEHTILMTESGPEILTLTQRGPQRGHQF